MENNKPYDFQAKCEEQIKKNHERKPLEEPKDLLPPLPRLIIKEDVFVPEAKDGIFKEGRWYEIWVNGEYVDHYENRGEATHNYFKALGI